VSKQVEMLTDTEDIQIYNVHQCWNVTEGQHRAGSNCSVIPQAHY